MPRLAHVAVLYDPTDRGSTAQLSYASSYTDNFRRVAYFVDKLLKGAKAGELAVEQPTKFELVLNLTTAKRIGFTFPQSFLIRADHVIG